MSTAEKLAHLTVRIECQLKSGEVSVGTGFHYNVNKGSGRNVPLIITNKHVVEGAEALRFVFTRKAADGSPDIGNSYAIDLKDLGGLCFPHPSQAIDLCAIAYGPIANKAESEGVELYVTQLDRSFIPNEESLNKLTGLESVLMIGYPTGLWDNVHNLPIFRRGVTATHYCVDWRGLPEFVIDCACFHGSSGSPVLIFDDGSYKDKEATHIRSRLFLLGALYAGPVFTAKGEIKIEKVPTASAPIVETGMLMNLGYVVKSSQLVYFDQRNY